MLGLTTGLEENVAALQVQLTTAELDELETAVPHGAVAGDRYPDMKHTSYYHEKE